MEWMVVVLHGRGRNEKGVTQGNSKAVTWANVYESVGTRGGPSFR